MAAGAVSCHETARKLAAMAEDAAGLDTHSRTEFVVRSARFWNGLSWMKLQEGGCRIAGVLQFRASSSFDDAEEQRRSNPGSAPNWQVSRTALEQSDTERPP
jgi:hypothetical protein